MPSPLSVLLSTFRQVNEAAQNYREYLEASEAATRAVLVDPVLSALGWELRRPDVVAIEDARPWGRNHVVADYVLTTTGGNAILVEAKKLGTDLNADAVRDQLIAYAGAFTTENIFLTDGLRWKHYTSIHVTGLRPTRELDVDADPLSAAAYLVNELDAAARLPESPEPEETLSADLAQVRAELEDLREWKTRVDAMLWPPREPDGPKLLQPLSPPGGWVSLRRVREVDAARTRPSRVRLPDGNEVGVLGWGQVLREAAACVLRSIPDLPMPFPDAARQTVLLISHTRITGRTQEELVLGQQRYFVNVNYSHNDKVRQTLYLLSRLPESMRKHEPAVEWDGPLQPDAEVQ